MNTIERPQEPCTLKQSSTVQTAALVYLDVSVFRRILIFGKISLPIYSAKSVKLFKNTENCLLCMFPRAVYCLKKVLKL